MYLHVHTAAIREKLAYVNIPKQRFPGSPPMGMYLRIQSLCQDLFITTFRDGNSCRVIASDTMQHLSFFFFFVQFINYTVQHLFRPQLNIEYFQHYVHII
jgi:urate oxidase